MCEGEFPEESVIQLARDTTLECKILTIKGDNATGFTVDYPNHHWDFPPGSKSDCSLNGGTMDGTDDTLEIQGSCAKVGPTFLYLIGITRDPNRPPDNHVVEWVADDEG